MMNKNELIKCAIKARKQAHSPYSDFTVGTAILTKDNKVYLGANIENVAYSATLCSERVAIAHAYMSGVKKNDIVAIAIAADLPTFVTPCGECRQVMSEMLNGSCKVYLANLHGKLKETTVSKLLPDGFDSIKKKLL